MPSRAEAARSVYSRSLGLALSPLALAGLALVCTETTLVLAGSAGPAWLFVSFAAVGLPYLSAGVPARRRGPSNRTGGLSCLRDVGSLAALAGGTGVPALGGPRGGGTRIAAEIPCGS